MVKNYLKSALRFLKRNKLFTGINIVGLSLALAASFIILLFIINEFSYNNCFKNRKQIYRVNNYFVEFKNTMAGTPYVMAGALKDEIPQIKYATRTRPMRGFRIKLKDEFIPVRLAIATDSEIFDIFDLQLTGNKENILSEMNSIVLSQKQANKFFPDESPIGKEVVALTNGEEKVFVVKGVFEDIPVNSTFRADCFINSKWTLAPINQAFRADNAETNWNFDFWNTWVILDKNMEAGSVEEQFKSLETKVFGAKPAHNYSLQNLSDIYLRSEDVMNSGMAGSMKNIRIFSAIAILIIIVAAFNYIILSTAVSTGRAKEIGIRKSNGASSGSIRKQLLNESVILTILVLPLALLLAWLGKPYAEDLFQTKLLVISSNIIIYVLVYVTLTLLIGLASGLYTSSYLSRLSVINILKNTIHTGRRKSSVRFTLIVIQLVIFCSFVSGTLIIRSQYKFALEKDPGYHKENILLFDMGRGFQNYSAFINSVQSYPNVVSAGGGMDNLPMLGSMMTMYDHFQDKTQKVKVEGMAVDYDFLETMGITILEGRSFSREFGTDLKSACILNETAVKQLGIEDPIGKKLGGKTIIGVAKDFNLHSIHNDIPPISIDMTDKYIHELAIRYKAGTLNTLLPLLEKEWKKVAPDRPFNYTTIEQLIESIYSSEKNLSVIISIFALFSMVIASFGLFGLTLYVAKARTKEIGIKKVFGSSEKGIVFSFLRTNFIMVVIASIFSVPVTILIMNRWLNNFAYKTNIAWWVFAIAFVVATTVVLTTVLFHSYRASRINPVEALKYE